MKTILTLALLISSIVTFAQNNLSEFPNTGLGIMLPDTSYKYGTRGFVSKKWESSFLLINQEGDLSNIDYNQFMNMMMREFQAPGITILADRYVSKDSSRIIKVSIDHDMTDRSPARKGSKGIGWFYFYNYRQKPVLLNASYKLSSDSLLSSSIERALLSLAPINSKSGVNVFKNSVRITKDHAPLLLCGPGGGGLLLNMQGKYTINGGDSSYCRIMPLTVGLVSKNSDSMRQYMLTRLQIHEKNDLTVHEWKWSIGGDNNSGISYEITAKASGNKILFLCIKSDPEGYFEIWGEAFKNNTSLIPVFRKIALSVERDK